MLLLSPQESAQWGALAREAQRTGAGAGTLDDEIRSNLKAPFRFFVGALLAAKGLEDLAGPWFVEGAQAEGPECMMNAFVAAFLKRHDGLFQPPNVAFADPAPYVHFAGVPAMRRTREAFLRQCGETLPAFRRPFRIVDIGCGDGGLLVRLLRHLREIGKVGDLGEVLLVDASPRMIDLAAKTVREAIPSAPIRTLTQRIQAAAASLEGGFDVALLSLCYHHMPWEEKVRHMMELKDKADHFVLLEMAANNDRPELYSPDLALSVYQSYGHLVDAVFAHDAPVELATACVDGLLMTEAISVLTQARGVRSDYHMLRGEWHSLFQETLGEGATCGCEGTAYAHDTMEFFTLHYRR